MRVLAGPKQATVPGDLLRRVVLRNDLAPVPQTVELSVRDDPRIRGWFDEDQTIIVGRDSSTFTIVKDGRGDGSGLVQGPRAFGELPVTALLASCAPVAQPRRTAVIREGASLGEIYRACGAKVSIASDFSVPRWSCFVGATPTEPIAIALQEEGAVLSSRGDRLQFRRLAELSKQQPVRTLDQAAATHVGSEFLERHSVPWAYSTDDAGAAVFGKQQSGRVARYWPRTSQRVLNNLSAALIRRCTLESDFAPDLLAGDVFSIAGTNLIVITAAHVWENAGPNAKQYSKFWLGEVVQ